MIYYNSFELKNSLKIYVHEDKTTPMAVVNIVYNVGSRDEDENKTGFAHLFEHLMFGGSKNIASYDEPLQKVGGENNAFTSPDITNYYITLPASNIETAFWLESDRMLSLSFDPKVLEVQRKVVIEEFKQRYLNQPYGDVWLKLRPLVYEKHPYRWATIGKEISHIEDATMNDVKDFFFTHYLPNNACMVVAGNVTTSEIEILAKKWFEPIPSGNKKTRNLTVEPKQIRPKFLSTENNVPLNALYKTYHMPGRFDKNFHEVDLLSDILGRGKSSRLYNQVVKEQKLFNNVSAYTLSSLDPGLLVISGNLNKGIELEEANAAIESIVEQISKEQLESSELEKVKNQSETTLAFSEIDLLHRAMNLAFAANVGHPEFCNEDANLIRNISTESLYAVANNIIRPENCSTLFYRSIQK
jgi:zinc protease